MYSSPAQIEILLIEDNPADVRLTREALKEGKFTNNLNVVMDGEEAIDFLYKQGKYSGAVTPDLILLDLNLPKLNGKEILEKIKSDDYLKFIPVIVLTTSDAEQDILKTYELHANCYITKPVDIDQFFDMIRKTEDFWITIVKLPNRPPNNMIGGIQRNQVISDF